jgi:wyosine [tRNA(Phe)-imidazoG37] synthetase (radical SAM superfamily)
MSDAKTNYEFIYGPVPSRRLGRSLGLDLVPYKVCSFNCIYCQVGLTTNLTTKRAEYNPPDQIMVELTRWLAEDGDAQYITMAGSGEPSLNSGMGRIVDFLKERTEIPLCLLTNGSLLWREDVREESMKFDLLNPSLDAATEEVFRRVNRPAKELTIERIIEGLAAAREQCPGEMWLEVMLVQGINDHEEELAAMAEAIGIIKPARVQINTVVRPSAAGEADALAAEALAHAKELLGPTAEIIAPLPADYGGDKQHQRNEHDVADMLRRRPCTLADIATGLGMHPNDIIKYLVALEGRGLIRSEQTHGDTYYVPA